MEGFVLACHEICTILLSLVFTLSMIKLVYWTDLEATNEHKWGTRFVPHFIFAVFVTTHLWRSCQEPYPSRKSSLPASQAIMRICKMKLKNASEALMPNGQPQQKSSYSINQQATIVERPPWFTPRKLCNQSCWSETLAVSLEQNKHELINIRDGMDLADVIIRRDKKKAEDMHPPRFSWFAQTLTRAMLPCLVPGTIFGLLNRGDIVAGHFFRNLRLHIKVPHIFSPWLRCVQSCTTPRVPFWSSLDQMVWYLSKEPWEQNIP
jgi:hypothetical protein